MIWFGLLAAFFIVAALVFLLPPLLRRTRVRAEVSRGAVNVNVYRDQLRELDADLAAGTLSQDRYDEARREIERQLLEDADDSATQPANTPARGVLTAVVVGMAVPLAAIGLYFAVGNPDGLLPQRVAASQDAHGLTPQQVEKMVERLAERLKTEPNNAEGWVMLARTYSAMGRFKEAAAAFSKATALVPNSAELLADHADALAMAQGRRLHGEPEKLIARALEVDPNNLKALALAGTAEFEKKQFGAAISYWQRLVNLVPPDSDAARAVQGSIAEARTLAGGATPGPRLPEAETPKRVAASGRVSGSVRLAPDLAGRVAPDDTVFIYARAAEGPRMPLAIVRKRAADLPAQFVLDDSMAMSPGMGVSSFEQIIIVARVSKNASANAQSGDFEGLSAPVKVGSADVSVVIDKVVR